MSKKSFKEIEHIIKAAAGSHEPDYDEASWEKMELLLDSEKDRRRPFFWIFWAGLLGIFVLGGVLRYQYNSKQHKAIEKENLLAGNNTNKPGENLKTGERHLTIAELEDSGSAQSDQTNGKDKAASAATGAGKHQNKNRSVSYVSAHQVQGGPVKIKTVAEASIDYGGIADIFKPNKKKLYTPGKTEIKVIGSRPTEENEPDQNITLKKRGDEMVEDVLQVQPVDISPENTDSNSVKKKESTEVVAKKKAENDKKKKSISALYVLASVGAEANGTKILSFANSTMAPRYGFGIGYQLTNKLSVQAGFYSSAKKYLAGPGDYKVKAGSYLSMVDIKKIDAECRVYEITLTIQYNLVTNPKTSYYLAGGLSSYLMKKENYKFTYTRNNNTYTYPYQYSKNTHLFAVLSISAGIEKKISRDFYLQVAPVINIPLGGVGEGKVKLFTTSLNAGIKYFPFKK